jgi:nucleotide-binding universal stress UspA family protein
MTVQDLHDIEPSSAGCVVVGVHDTLTAAAAIRVGAEQARVRHVPLHLVYVWRDVGWFPSMTATDVVVMPSWENRGAAALARAVVVAREAEPSIEVVPVFLSGGLYATLLEQSRGAALLVLGDRPGFTGPGSIGAWFVGHADCPVMIVHASGRIVTPQLSVA